MTLVFFTSPLISMNLLFFSGSCWPLCSLLHPVSWGVSWESLSQITYHRSKTFHDLRLLNGKGVCGLLTCWESPLHIPWSGKKFSTPSISQLIEPGSTRAAGRRVNWSFNLVTSYSLPFEVFNRNGVQVGSQQTWQIQQRKWDRVCECLYFGIFVNPMKHLIHHWLVWNHDQEHVS